MIGITAKPKVSITGAASKLRKIATNKAFGSFLAEEAADGMDKYVPMRTGALAESVTTSPFKVTYNAPYALYVFNGRSIRLTRDKHPLATPQWHRAYEIIDGDKLAKAGTEYLKGL